MGAHCYYLLIRRAKQDETRGNGAREQKYGAHEAFSPRNGKASEKLKSSSDKEVSRREATICSILRFSRLLSEKVPVRECAAKAGACLSTSPLSVGGAALGKALYSLAAQ